MSKYLCLESCLHGGHFYTQGRIFDIDDKDIGVAAKYFEKLSGKNMVSKEAALTVAREKIRDYQSVASLPPEKVAELRELLKFVEENS